MGVYMVPELLLFVVVIIVISFSNYSFRKINILGRTILQNVRVQESKGAWGLSFMY